MRVRRCAREAVPSLQAASLEPRNAAVLQLRVLPQLASPVRKVPSVIYAAFGAGVVVGVAAILLLGLVLVSRERRAS